MQFYPQTELFNRIDKQTENYDHRQCLDPGWLLEKDLRQHEREILEKVESSSTAPCSL